MISPAFSIVRPTSARLASTSRNPFGKSLPYNSRTLTSTGYLALVFAWRMVRTNHPVYAPPRRGKGEFRRPLSMGKNQCPTRPLLDLVGHHRLTTHTYSAL